MPGTRRFETMEARATLPGPRSPRDALLEPAIAAHGGIVIKRLTAFDLVGDAARGAMDLQDRPGLNAPMRLRIYIEAVAGRELILETIYPLRRLPAAIKWRLYSLQAIILCIWAKPVPSYNGASARPTFASRHSALSFHISVRTIRPSRTTKQSM
jgi:hypothetical protein